MQTLPEIKNQLSHKDLFEAFKVQLKKDFEQSNFPSDFIGTLEPSYTGIHEKIRFELQCSGRRVELMPLLHRIDISEAQLKKYLEEYKNENHFVVIAELIIKRVLQKVVLKQHFKNTQQL